MEFGGSCEVGMNSCPKCGVSWIGESIPKKDRKYFGKSTHFKREIGIYDIGKDRTVADRKSVV